MQKRIYLLNALFLFPMWISKTLQPLFWAGEGKLSLFSLSYVAMAVAGSLSIFYSSLIVKTGIRSALLIGYALYGTGLIMRAYPHNAFLAILTGLTAGIGASVTGITLRALLLEIDDVNRKKAVLHTDNISTLSQSFGAMLSGLLVSFVSFYFHDGYQISLWITGLLAMSSVLFVPKTGYKDNFSVHKKGGNSLPLKKKPDTITTFIFIACFAQGLCWAVLIPLVPIYLKDMGYSINYVGVILSSGVALGFILKNTYVSLTKKYNINNSLMLFTFLSSISVFLSMWLLSERMKLYFAIAIIAFYTFKATMSLILNFIEMNIAEKGRAHSVFGIRQTAFLTGDIAGGILMPFVYNHNILTRYSLIVPVLLLIASALIKKCDKLAERKEWSQVLTR
ncbi:MFS transporter [Pantoea agglomerans]|uniref:MFS transporter n=1 Tax=Enterobacter agglomerans TaxID=549 RepID=UPI0023B194A4|nr:MFS transporter [Pantoea agglomerans]WEC75231.1 MFS transporter [Pantoea agglomerans]WNK38022.1 MFS transporter [Pantoea agglomerans]WNK56206.1 MFS transporter [Pantoea agglomerans]WNK74160.1 MFS transporter [Pantoea agglomerans]